MNIYVFVVVVESASLFLSDRRRGEKGEDDDRRRGERINKAFLLFMLVTVYYHFLYDKFRLKPKTLKPTQEWEYLQPSNKSIIWE